MLYIDIWSAKGTHVSDSNTEELLFSLEQISGVFIRESPVGFT